MANTYPGANTLTLSYSALLLIVQDKLNADLVHNAASPIRVTNFTPDINGFHIDFTTDIDKSTLPQPSAAAGSLA